MVINYSDTLIAKKSLELEKLIQMFHRILPNKLQNE